MNITAELSLYPLGDDYKTVVLSYLEALNSFSEIEVRTHALSTELYGEYDIVMDAVKRATRTVFELDKGVVLVAKFLNNDRRNSY